MVDQDIEAKARAVVSLWGPPESADNYGKLVAEVAQLVQEERDRCVDTVVRTIGQGLPPSVLPYVTAAWAEHMRTQGGTRG